MDEGCCRNCKDWSPRLDYDGHCSDCARQAEDTVLTIADGVRGRCEGCRRWETDLWALDGRTLCKTCHDIASFRAPPYFDSDGRFAHGFFWGMLAASLIYILTIIAR